MKTRLIDLHPRWMRKDKTALKFTCPICNWHSIGISVKAPSLFTNGHIWNMVGTTFEDLSISPSISCVLEKEPTGCTFHGFIRSGWVEY